jgi:hypothetical protein
MYDSNWGKANKKTKYLLRRTSPHSLLMKIRTRSVFIGIARPLGLRSHEGGSSNLKTKYLLRKYLFLFAAFPFENFVFNGMAANKKPRSAGFGFWFAEKGGFVPAAYMYLYTMTYKSI